MLKISGIYWAWTAIFRLLNNFARFTQTHVTFFKRFKPIFVSFFRSSKKFFFSTFEGVSNVFLMSSYFFWTWKDLTKKRDSYKNIFFFALKIVKFNFSDFWRSQQRRFNSKLFFWIPTRSFGPEKYPPQGVFFALTGNYFWICSYKFLCILRESLKQENELDFTTMVQ